jgi:hypothetical protein
MVTIIKGTNKSECYEDPNKIVVISTTGGSGGSYTEKHYCLMCQYLSGRYDSIMKYDKNTKVWMCLVCRYVIDPSLNQTVKTEHKPTIENDSATTRPVAIPLKNFSYNHHPDLYELNAIRSRPKCSSASEAWRAADNDDDNVI